jgi:hypothetical protein
MMLFATPDSGATGIIMMLFLLVVFGTVVVLPLVGFFRGKRMLKSQSRKARRRGLLLMLASVLIPLSCCLGPSQVVRLVSGNYPIGHYPNNITRGMSADEVEATLGSPHQRWKRGNVDSWYYWIDSFGIYWFGVDFGPDKRVTKTYGD